MKYRAALLSLLLALAGCSGSPADLGITGPGQPPPAPPPSGDDVFDSPAYTVPGTGYGPNYMPGSGNTNGGRFFNYN
jgi:hypothetical protein